MNFSQKWSLTVSLNPGRARSVLTDVILRVPSTVAKGDFRRSTLTAISVPGPRCHRKGQSSVTLLNVINVDRHRSSVVASVWHTGSKPPTQLRDPLWRMLVHKSSTPSLKLA